MTLFVFWNYNLLHNKIPAFTIDDYNDLNMTFNELIDKYRYNFSKDLSITINFLRVYKKNPKQLIDSNNPYWDKKTKIKDYIDFYNIQSNKCDIIFKLTA